MKVTQRGEFQIATRESRTGKGFIAWARRGAIVVESPMHEPWDVDVWFEFGKTEEEALLKLLIELDKSNGPSLWTIGLGMSLGVVLTGIALGWWK